jgi:hypothetical protein
VNALRAHINQWKESAQDSGESFFKERKSTFRERTVSFLTKSIQNDSLETVVEHDVGFLGEYLKTQAQQMIGWHDLPVSHKARHGIEALIGHINNTRELSSPIQYDANFVVVRLTLEMQAQALQEVREQLLEHLKESWTRGGDTPKEIPKSAGWSRVALPGNSHDQDIRGLLAVFYKEKPSLAEIIPTAKRVLDRIRGMSMQNQNPFLSENLTHLLQFENVTC